MRSEVEVSLTPGHFKICCDGFECDDWTIYVMKPSTCELPGASSCRIAAGLLAADHDKKNGRLYLKHIPVFHR